MRVATLVGPRRFELEQRPTPAPGPGQIRIAIEGCGVCGSDLPVWQGREWFEYPREPGAPGHEAWGSIDAVGTGVDGLAVGDRVGCLSFRSYAEFDLAEADAVVRLPDELRGRPFPAEPLACAMNVIERARVRAGQRVAVVGSGFLGSLLVGLAAARGASVAGVSRRATGRDAALAMGAELSPAFGPETEARVADWTGGALCDVVIEATGAQDALDLASALTRVRGTLVLAGYHQDGRRSVDMQLWNWRGLDVINAHERDPARYVGGMRAAVAAVTGGELAPDRLYTHRFELERIDAAFATLDARPDGFVKAMLVP
jgi:threonine dehydrogenase-like Zn-dependent dehydrogenase